MRSRRQLLDPILQIRFKCQLDVIPRFTHASICAVCIFNIFVCKLMQIPMFAFSNTGFKPYTSHFFSRTRDCRGTDLWAFFMYSKQGIRLCSVWVVLMGRPVYPLSFISTYVRSFSYRCVSMQLCGSSLKILHFHQCIPLLYDFAMYTINRCKMVWSLRRYGVFRNKNE